MIIKFKNKEFKKLNKLPKGIRQNMPRGIKFRPKFEQKQPAALTSFGLKPKYHFGAYPVPGGRILERYAYKHNLMPNTPKLKKILFSGNSKFSFSKDPEVRIIGQEPYEYKHELREIPKKNLSFHQAIRRYPNMSIFKDTDKDGVVNMFDCKPFNKKKQDDEFDDYYGSYSDTGVDDNTEMKDKTSGKMSMNKENWSRVADDMDQPIKHRLLQPKMTTEVKSKTMGDIKKELIEDRPHLNQENKEYVDKKIKNISRYIERKNRKEWNERYED